VAKATAYKEKVDEKIAERRRKFEVGKIPTQQKP
jgi:hypothetical protein